MLQCFKWLLLSPVSTWVHYWMQLADVPVYGIFPTSGHVRANSPAPSSPAFGWGLLWKQIFKKILLSKFSKQKLPYGATGYKMFLWSFEGTGKSLPDKDTCSWRDEQTPLSLTPPGWATAISPALLDTHISLEHKPNQPILCFVGQLQEPVWLEVCVSEGTVTMQPEDKQALTSCFCYWTPVISSDWHLVGALVLAHSSAIVHFLIRNLSNRSVHLRVTEKPPSFSLTAFPLPPVLQQLRSTFQFALENVRTRVTQYLKKSQLKNLAETLEIKFSFCQSKMNFFTYFLKINVSVWIQSLLTCSAAHVVTFGFQSTTLILTAKFCFSSFKYL